MKKNCFTIQSLNKERQTLTREEHEKREKQEITNMGYRANSERKVQTIVIIIIYINRNLLVL